MLKMKGMVIIILVWIGFGGVGLSFIWMIIERIMMIGRM